MGHYFTRNGNERNMEMYAVQQIPLSELRMSPQNARKTKGGAQELGELKASLAAHGLDHNLVVQPSANGDGVFLVVSGGRRYRAMTELVKEGVFDSAISVPCKVLSPEDDAFEHSLAENMVRHHMHPADQFEAFARLVKDGQTSEQIAQRFGLTEKMVTQRLKLGRLAPSVLKEYRKGNLDLEDAMAFTLTDDRKRQAAVLESFLSSDSWNRGPRLIRHMLTEEAVPGSSKVVRYVTVAAYEKAGGTITRDLFADHDDDVYLDNAQLLYDLATAKLGKQVAKLQKEWKWAEAMIEVTYADRERFKRLSPIPDKPTDAEATEIERLKAELQQVQEGDDSHAQWPIRNQLREAERGQRQRAVFSDEQKAVSGCLVSVGHDGTCHVEHGFVMREDEKEAKALAVGGLGNSGERSDTGSPAKKARAAAGISEKVEQFLAYQRTTFVKSMLMDDPDLAFDLLVFQTAFGLGAYDSPLAVSVEDTGVAPGFVDTDDEEAEWYAGNPALERFHNRFFELRERGFDQDWEAKDVAKQFAAFREFDADTKRQVFAFHMAKALQVQTGTMTTRSLLAEAAIAGMEPAFAEVRPVADTFWSKISRPTIQAIVTAVGGEFADDWLGQLKPLKKGELASYMEAVFANPARPQREIELPETVQAAIRAWTPMGFEAAPD